MSLYRRTHDGFQVTEPVSMLNELPVGTYEIAFSQMLGYTLRPTQSYEIPSKVYGNATSRADRIISTFESRPFTTGLLLSGEKGAGKTLLGKLLSTTAASKGISTLVVNQPHYGPDFNLFLQAITEPCIVMFDEFEKVYRDETQDHLLSLFDGLYQTKKLFVLTTNEKYAINRHMLNRPGRLFYHLEYNGINTDFIIEYCNDNLNNKDNINQVVNVSNMFNVFNFDMLKALVEEMNRYNESAIESLEMLNMKPDSREGLYDISVVINGHTLDSESIDISGRSAGNPLMRRDIRFDIYVKPAMLLNVDNRSDGEQGEKPIEKGQILVGGNTNIVLHAKVDAIEESSDDSVWFGVAHTNESLTSVDAASGTYTYDFTYRGEHLHVVYTKRKEKEYDWKQYIF